jgi:hypothetical protein
MKQSRTPVIPMICAVTLLAASATFAQQAPTPAPRSAPARPGKPGQVIQLPPGLKLSPLKPAPTRLVRGGSNNGGSGRGSADVVETLAWCRGSQGILAEARDQAMLAALDDDLAAGYQALLNGMARALDRAEGEDAFSSLTWRALSRGLELAAALESIDPDLDPRFEMRMAFFLRYYAFLDRVAKDLDVPYYVPARAGEVDESRYETRFVDYAREQLSWLLETFAEHSSVFGVIPRLPASTYLTALEFVTAYVTDDLAESLWAARHACAIEELRLLQEKLAAHNAGNRAYFRDDRRAVNATYAQLVRIGRTLGQGCSR